MKIPNPFNKYRKHELVGYWDTEDGSGFSMIMGAWLEFKSDGTGSYESWHNDPFEENSYHLKGAFTWESLSENTIKLIETTKANERVEDILTYHLKVDSRVALTSTNPELEDVAMESFWKFGQALFKTT